MADVIGVVSDLVPKVAVSVAIARVVTALALTSLVLSASACSSPPAPPGNPSASAMASRAGAAAPLVLTADVAFPRTLQAQRWVEIRLAGAQGEDWVVTSATLDSTTFATLAATESNVRLFEGYVARVRVPLGEATCPAATGDSIVKLTVTNDAGASENLEVALPAEVLTGINADECAVRRVLDVASPALGAAGEASGTTVETTLTVSRGSEGADASVVVTAMRGSVIFDMQPRAGATLPASVGTGESTLELPVTLTASRCDPHAFAESKKTFVFGVWLTIDGGTEKYIEIRPDAALEAALQSAFDNCGKALDATTPGGA